MQPNREAGNKRAISSPFCKPSAYESVRLHDLFFFLSFFCLNLFVYFSHQYPFVCMLGACLAPWNFNLLFAYALFLPFLFSVFNLSGEFLFDFLSIISVV